jgi:hypothetical protein
MTKVGFSIVETRVHGELIARGRRRIDGFELSQRTVSVFGSPLVFMPQKNSFESKRESLKVHPHCQKRREVELRFAVDILFLRGRHELCQKDLESLKMNFW